MRNAFGLTLTCIGFLGYGWTILQLKPGPQIILALLPLLALSMDIMTRSNSRTVMFLITASLAVFSGYLYVFPEAVAKWAAGGGEERTMQLVPLLLGAVAGTAFAVATIVTFLKPHAGNDRFRRTGLAALTVVALVAWGLDRLPA